MDKLKTLTERERAVFEYIRENINERGYAPSVRDICAACDIKSTSTVYNYLLRLEEKGVISKAPGKSRTLRVAGGTPKRVARVPILGKVAAGTPISAIENYDGYVDIANPRSSVDPDDLFALTVQGESMIEAGILDGDLIVVEKSETAQSGEIIVAMVDGEATVKILKVEGEKTLLVPANKTMSPIEVDKPEILGKVYSCVRFYGDTEQ